MTIFAGPAENAKSGFGTNTRTAEFARSPVLAYIQSLRFNLAHLGALREPPTKNLATADNGLPPTETDSFLGPQISWRSIPFGPSGTRATLKVMAGLAREAAGYDPFRRYALSLFRTPAQLDSWLREHFSYREENEEIVRSPILMVGDMGRLDGDRQVGLEGDCDDAAALAAAFAKAIGYPARLVAIRYHPEATEFEHVFAQVLDQAIWKTIDPTVTAGTTIRAIEIMVETV